jgi:hypothetical protein
MSRQSKRTAVARRGGRGGRRGGNLRTWKPAPRRAPQVRQDSSFSVFRAGDAQFEGALARAGWITPVPAGVGPMTVAILMRTLESALKRI